MHISYRRYEKVDAGAVPKTLTVGSVRGPATLIREVTVSMPVDEVFAPRKAFWQSFGVPQCDSSGFTGFRALLSLFPRSDALNWT